MEVRMIKVIRVTKNDVSIINEILTHHIDHSDKRKEPPSLSYLEELLNDERTYLFAALCSDMVTGYVLAYRFPSLYASEYLAYLYDIEVALENRRQGIGRLLVETLLAHLQLDGVKEIWLGTAVDNVEGQALFHATGALKSGETFNDYTYYLE
jgi:ribosomal protein S18 acetylase RimI-like enzyme